MDKIQKGTKIKYKKSLRMWQDENFYKRITLSNLRPYAFRLCRFLRI